MFLIVNTQRLPVDSITDAERTLERVAVNYGRALDGTLHFASGATYRLHCNPGSLSTDFKISKSLCLISGQGVANPANLEALAIAGVLMGVNTTGNREPAPWIKPIQPAPSA